MAMTTSKHQRGFTLIEMSIVLVIIGLIIGGILKGQELIESARQKNVVSQIDQLRAVVNTFQDRFKSLPGDYSLASSNINSILTPGNDDGVISTAATGGPYPASASELAQAKKDSGEEMQFFNHLAAANMLGGGSVTNLTQVTGFAGTATGSPLPTAAYPQTGLSLIYGTHPGSSTTADSRQTHWIVVSRFGSTLIQTGAATAALPPQRAAQLDAKYDDGLPDSGLIRTFDLTADCGTTGADKYIATATSTECELVFALQ